MNKSNYSGEEVRDKFPSAKNLKELIVLLEDEFHLKGEVVCQLWINGTSLGEEDEIKLGSTLTGEINSLQVETQKPGELLKNLLNNWLTELPVLIGSVDALAQAVKFEGMDGQYKDFVDLIESCQFLIDSLLSLQKVIQVSSELAPIWIKNSQDTAQAIHDCLAAFEKKDFVLLAELMEYDLGNSLQEWKDILEVVRKDFPSKDEIKSSY
jgi:hypothetical protein